MLCMNNVRTVFAVCVFFSFTVMNIRVIRTGVKVSQTSVWKRSNFRHEQRSFLSSFTQFH